MKRIVLDASALVAFFENEPGAEEVEEIVREAMDGKKELLMSVVNWGEVYYSRWQKGGPEAAAKALHEIGQLSIEVVDADQELTKLAAEFKAKFKLPYADSFAAALAKVRRASVVTKDSDFSKVAKEISIEVI